MGIWSDIKQQLGLPYDNYQTRLVNPLIISNGVLSGTITELNGGSTIDMFDLQRVAVVRLTCLRCGSLLLGKGNNETWQMAKR